MRIRVEVLSTCVLLSAVPAAWANGGGAMEMPQGNSREESPQYKAKERYNDGVREVRKADRFQDSAAQLVDPAKKARALREARSRYSSSLGQFQEAVQLAANMHEARH